MHFLLRLVEWFFFRLSFKKRKDDRRSETTSDVRENKDIYPLW